MKKKSINLVLLFLKMFCFCTRDDAYQEDKPVTNKPVVEKRVTQTRQKRSLASLGPDREHLHAIEEVEY